METAPTKKRGRSDDSCKVIVIGIPTSMPSARLEVLCQKYGNVKNANIALDKETGKSKGFGFVEFDDYTCVEKAINGLNNTKISGRTLHVRSVESKVVPKEIRKPKKRPCFSFVKKGRCVKGEACRFSHLMTQTPIGGNIKGEGKDDQKPKSLLDNDEKVTLTKVPEGYCFLFQRGSCHRGKACRYKHAKPDESQVKKITIENKPLLSLEETESKTKSEKKNKSIKSEKEQFDYSSESESEEEEEEESTDEKEEAPSKKIRKDNDKEWYGMDGKPVQLEEDDDGVAIKGDKANEDEESSDEE